MNVKLKIFLYWNLKKFFFIGEDPKSNVAVSSDDDDSIITNCNTPILTYNSKKFDHFISLNDKSQSAKSNLQRRPCSFSLTPVVEDINDEIYFCWYHRLQRSGGVESHQLQMFRVRRTAPLSRVEYVIREIERECE